MDPATTARDVTTRRVLLVLLLFALFGLHLGDVGLLEKDEARYAQAAREMRRSGDFLVPTLMGAPRLNKPPLLYWLIAAGQATLGENEFSARLPSAICGVLISLLVFIAARRMAGEIAGTWAAVVYATTVFGLGMARLAHPESLLSLGVTGATVCFYLAWRGGFAKRRIILCFWLLAGFGFLGKGPHGILLPFLIAAAFLLVRWDPRALGKLMIGRGLLLALLPVAVWGGITLLVAGPAAGELWMDETLGRISGRMDYHPEPAWFFFRILPAALAPWTLLLPLVIAVFRRKTGAPAGGLFLLVWALVPFVFFSIAVNKVAAYMLSVVPPLAAATGIALTRLTAGRALRATGWAFATLAVALAGVIAYAPIPEVPVFPPGAPIAAILVVIAVLVFGAATALAGQARRFAAGSVVGVVLIMAGGVSLFLPSFESTHSLKPAGLLIHERIRPEDLLANTGTASAGLSWYADHEVDADLTIGDLYVLWNGGRRIFACGRVKDFAPLRERLQSRLWTLWTDPAGKYTVITNFDFALR
jgi:4-amino-4-deoxy-L-arabinose transferase-like glycosyltransferase